MTKVKFCVKCSDILFPDEEEEKVCKPCKENWVVEE